MAADTFEVNGAEAADFSTSNVKPTSVVSRVKVKTEWLFTHCTRLSAWKLNFISPSGTGRYCQSLPKMFETQTLFFCMSFHKIQLFGICSRFRSHGAEHFLFGTQSSQQMRLQLKTLFIFQLLFKIGSSLRQKLRTNGSVTMCRMY